MKRFLLFSGDCYYPGGGWDDFKGDFDTAESAQAKSIKERDDWWHVVDTTTMKEVKFLAADGTIRDVPPHS